MIIEFDHNKTGYQFFQRYDWIKAFGVHYEVGVDGIALVLVGLAALLVPVVLIASWDEVDARRGHRQALGRRLLRADPGALQAGMVGVFVSLDVFLFYVFFEAILIPMYFIIGSYGGPQRAYASVKFLLYSLFGGLIMLAAVIGLYVVSTKHGVGTFDFISLRGMPISDGVEKLLFLGFFLAFAIKAPLFPFHTWLPDAGAEAPIGGAVLLVGVLDKIGTFGLIRYCIPLFPKASHYFAPLVLALAVVGIFYGALLAIGQRDMKRLVSYTSLAHFGFIALGTLRPHHPGRHRSGALHGQPRPVHRRALPLRRLPDRAPRHARRRWLPGDVPGHPEARRRHADRRPVRALAAGSVDLHQ